MSSGMNSGMGEGGEPAGRRDDRLDVVKTAPLWLRITGLAVLSLTLSAFAWWPMLWAYPNTQHNDAQVFHKMLEAARVSVIRYHELPLWNPYECGGLPLWDNPQAPIASPLIWPALLIGTTAAMSLWYVVHSALGFASMWLFARHELRLSQYATFIASAAWAYSGFHQQHYGGGHLVFVSFLFFPLALLLWRRAERDLRCAIGLGLLVAFMMLEGGVYPIPHLAAILFVETLMRLWPLKRIPKIALAGVVVSLVAIGVGAVRFFPVIAQLKAHTRPIGAEGDALQLGTLKDMFVSRAHPWTVPGQSYVWPEYGTYLGTVLVAFAILGLLLTGFEHLWLVILLAFSFALMLGHAGKWAPWSVLKGHVFPFKEMRVPSRFRVEVSLFLAAFVGLAIDAIGLRARKYLPHYAWAESLRGVMISIALLGVGDMMSVGFNVYEEAFQNPPEDKKLQASPHFYYGGSDLAPLIMQPRQNRGRLACWEEWGFGATAPLWEGDVPQARAADEGAVIDAVSRTQNTFTLDVTATRPTRILLDSAYDRGFRTNVGSVAEQNLELVVDVPEGKHHILIRYLPRGLLVGAIVTFITLSCVLAFFLVTRRKRQAR